MIVVLAAKKLKPKRFQINRTFLVGIKIATHPVFLLERRQYLNSYNIRIDEVNAVITNVKRGKDFRTNNYIPKFITHFGNYAKRCLPK